jgi:hypothetical protein
VESYRRDILRAIAPVLKDLPNRISLAGHIDDLPYATGERYYSNWELSANRANASRRELIGGGLAEEKVPQVLGMASTMSLKQHGAEDAINRRITILVLNKEIQQSIEHENVESNAMEIGQPEGVLRQLALEAQQQGTSAAALAIAPLIVESTAASDEGVCICLSGLKPSEIPLMLEELGSLGEVQHPQQSENSLEVTLLTSAREEAISAVLCFVLEMEQIAFTAPAQRSAAGSTTW